MPILRRIIDHFRAAAGSRWLNFRAWFLENRNLVRLIEQERERHRWDIEGKNDTIARLTDNVTSLLEELQVLRSERAKTIAINSRQQAEAEYILKRQAGGAAQ